MKVSFKMPVEQSGYYFKIVKNFRQWLIWVPVVSLLLWCALAFNEKTYWLATSGLRGAREYTLIEMATAFSFLGAFVIGLALSWWHAYQPKHKVQVGFYILFSLVAAFALLEEIQWGQPILGYNIPSWMMDINRQQEFTLHNIEGIHGKAELFYFAFCGAAAILFLPRFPLIPSQIWSDVRADSALIPLVGCIFATALLKTFQGAFDPSSIAFDAIRWTTELTELFIAVWGLAYVAINFSNHRMRKSLTP